MKFYPYSQLARFGIKDFEKEIFGRTFVCEKKDHSTIEGVVKDILPSQPDNLPSSIIIETKEGETEEIQVLDIERLTLGD